MKPPCIKNGVKCPRRHLGCQATCEDLAKLHEHNAAIHAARDKEYEYLSYVVPVIIRNKIK